MNFVVALIHTVADLDGAGRFLIEQLGYEERERGPGYWLLSNDSLGIRLVQGESDGGPMRLDVRSRNPSRDAQKYLALEGVSELEAEHFPHMHRAELTLSAPHGLELTLSRRYTEDELGVMPALETELDWDREAADLIRRLLRMVPEGFRDSARGRAVDRAEALAAENGLLEVDRDTALRGLIAITPKFQHPYIRELLHNENIPTEGLFED